MFLLYFVACIILQKNDTKDVVGVGRPCVDYFCSVHKKQAGWAGFEYIHGGLCMYLTDFTILVK